MKKFTAVLTAIVIICTMLCSCTADNAKDNAVESTSYSSTAVSSTAVTEETAAEKSDTSAADKTSSAQSTTAKSSNKKSKQTTAKKKSSTTAKKSTAKSKPQSTTVTSATTTTTTTPADVLSSTAVQNGSASDETHKQSSETQTSSQITCNVTIECKSILDNKDDLKAGHESYVPSNGVILNSYSLTLKSGSTAYDALEKACDDNDIKLTAQKTGYGTYVSGINNLDEKDCGKNSGWLYSVNGVKPNISCGKYKLKSGDKIVFSYTC